MMTNLFTIFDPTTTIFSMNWISMFIPFIIIPFSMWMIQSQSNAIILNILKLLNMEFNTLFNKKILKIMSFILISMMMFIAINNLFGLLPYIFTATSHIMITLMMALPIWLTFMLYGWINNTSLMFAHMIPQGTPPMLMMFMVCIESISNMIRPITLSVRLAANMIAGHLLISLLSDCTMNSNIIQIPALLVIQIMLMFLETAVAFIQSYVFVILIGLYSTEIVH